MNDLENRLHESLHAATDPATGGMSGPALRRAARSRTVRVRTGGVAALGAAGAVAVLVAPGLLSAGPTTSVSPGAAPAPTLGKGAQQSAQQSAVITLKAAPRALTDVIDKNKAASAGGQTVPGGGKAIPAQAGVWNPAGSLIADPTVLRHSPDVAATDPAWLAWGGPLLDRDTVHVVFADRASVLSIPQQYPRPLVIVTGRTSADSPTLRVAALTTIEAGSDKANLNRLTVEAMTAVPVNGPQVIAVSEGYTMFVVAEAGVDSATFTYTDATGKHTAAMQIANGVAFARTPMATLKASGETTITIKAVSHGKTIWDAAPVTGR